MKTVEFGTYYQDFSGKQKPIEWLVLDEDDEKVLLLSKYGLAQRRFDKESNDFTDSELFKWLNTVFKPFAFSPTQFEHIIGDIGLLSVKQVNEYFSCDDERICFTTEAVGGDDCWWWLRSSGSSSSDAADVYPNGSVNSIGNIVDCSGSAVRPAMLVKKSKIFPSLNLEKLMNVVD